MREQRLEHLLQGAVQRADDRQTREGSIAQAHEKTPKQGRRQGADRRQADDDDDEAGARDGERQMEVNLGTVGLGNERGHQRVDPADDGQHDPHGQRHRGGEQESGQEPAAQPREQPSQVVGVFFRNHARFLKRKSLRVSEPVGQMSE